MKRLSPTTVLALAAALLLPACSAPTPSSPAVPEAGQGAPIATNPQHRSYAALLPEEEAALRRAFRECARVDVARGWVRSVRENERCTLQRGPELEALLAQLLAVPRWYRATHPLGLCYTPAFIESVRFYDSAGRLMSPALSSFQTSKDCYFYADAEGRPIVLTDIFSACLPEPR